MARYVKPPMQRRLGMRGGCGVFGTATLLPYPLESKVEMRGGCGVAGKTSAGASPPLAELIGGCGVTGEFTQTIVQATILSGGSGIAGKAEAIGGRRVTGGCGATGKVASQSIELTPLSGGCGATGNLSLEVNEPIVLAGGCGITGGVSVEVTEPALLIGGCGVTGRAEVEVIERTVLTGGCGAFGKAEATGQSNLLGGIPTNGLTRCLVAKSGVTKDANDKVFLWEDIKITDSIESWPYQEPTWIAADGRGQNTIRFVYANGEHFNNSLTESKPLSNYVAADGSAFTAFALIRPIAAYGAPQTSFYSIDSIVKDRSGYFALALNSTPAIVAGVWDGGGQQIEAPIALGDEILVTWWLDPVSGLLNLQIDQGVIVQTACGAISSRFGEFEIGGTGATAYDGDLKALIMYNVAQNASERQTTQNAIATEFGLTF